VVVTNAHVVAGESDTVVQVGGHGPNYPAAPLLFDPHDDIAILRVPNLRLRPLALASVTATGTAAAILGYPLDGPFVAEPGRLGVTERTSTEDAYGNGPVTRSISSLRGRVRPGNSGGPLVDAGGHVLATVFAAITNAPRGEAGGFAVPNALVRGALATAAARSHTVGSGPCAG
jgi:S1-C subfamily serine protease